MKIAALALVVAVVTSACSSPPPPTAKVLSDDEFIAKLSGDHPTASTPGPWWGDYNAQGAAAVCRTFVRARLKAPASAQFPDEAPTTSDLRGGKFRVQAAVDSQNSFGALIRNDYDCVVQWTHGTDWTLETIELKGR